VPSSWKLLELLAQGERSVEVLAGRAGLGLTRVSNHLQILHREDVNDQTMVRNPVAGAQAAEIESQAGAESVP
jgi:hypothetical protein